MDWFIFALLAALALTTQKILSRRVLKNKVDTTVFTILNDSIGGLTILPAVLIFGFVLPSGSLTWILFIFSVIAYGLGDYYTFRALEEIPVSTWQILTQVRHIAVLIGGFLIFFEPITFSKVFGILMIILGAFVTLYQKYNTSKKNDLYKGALFTFISAFLFAGGFLAGKIILSDFSLALYASLNMIGVGAGGFLIMTLRGRKNHMIKEAKNIGRKAVLPGIFIGLYDIFLFLSFKLGEISKAVPVTQSTLIFTVIAGIIFLKETDRLRTKIIGLLIMAAGVLGIYLL